MATREASSPSPKDSADRREAVLRSAMGTFARLGYQRASMDQIAQDADISRPGLYFLFASKPALFGEAVEQTLTEDLAAVRGALDESGAPLSERLLRAFDRWAGRYIGPLARDVPALVDDNVARLGATARRAPQQFARLVEEAIDAEFRERQDAVDGARSREMAQTLISSSIGLKHQVSDRRRYRERMQTAITLIVP